MSEHHDQPTAGPETTVIGITAPAAAVGAHHQLAQEELAAIQALPADSALLIASEGSQAAGARFLLDADLSSDQSGTGIVAGRHPEADIFLDDVTVSRRHALFQFNAGTFELTDTGSLNGTYVNGDRIDHIVLHNGDEVRIGKFVFVFCTADAA